MNQIALWISFRADEQVLTCLWGPGPCAEGWGEDRALYSDLSCGKTDTMTDRQKRNHFLPATSLTGGYNLFWMDNLKSYVDLDTSTEKNCGRIQKKNISMIPLIIGKYIHKTASLHEVQENSPEPSGMITTLINIYTIRCREIGLGLVLDISLTTHWLKFPKS